MKNSKRAKKTSKKPVKASADRRPSDSVSAEKKDRKARFGNVGNRPEILPSRGEPSPEIVEPSEADSFDGETDVDGPNPHRFIVVGIGASAGGLDAFERFFRQMPPDSGMAFVLVPHLDPLHATHLPELIQRATAMPVFLVSNRSRVRPNTVYIIPPDWIMGIVHGHLHLVRRTETGSATTISYFMRTLAEDQGENAVCVIFSGMGADGSDSAVAVKAEGGLVIAQDPATAKYDSMPRAAIESGYADHVLAPEDMPRLLVEHSRAVLERPAALEGESNEQLEEHLGRVFSVLHLSTGHDFSSYKRSTILRRIQRRMSMNQAEKFPEYIQLLSDSPTEAKLLMEELLIGVTRFFRDPEAFETLKQTALLPLLQNLPAEHSIRVWVPGCSGGEEAYSIAMILRECFDELHKEWQVQIFATDIDAFAIDRARVGLYPASIAEEVGEPRLQKYFDAGENAYRVKSTIRQMLVFAAQNIIKDPPFTRLDLLCCRNLLIYFDNRLQKRLLPLFHYSLRPKGVLFLGTSETVGAFTDYFSTVDKKWKIYSRRELAALAPSPVDFAPLDLGRTKVYASPSRAVNPNLAKMVERTLLQQFAPPAVLINVNGDILFIHGRTGDYLEPPQGSANWRITDMAREGLKMPLANAIRKAGQDADGVIARGVKIRTNGDSVSADIHVRPFGGREAAGLFLVTFEQVEPVVESTTKASRDGEGNGTYVDELERELNHTREHLQTSVEELETSNEELRSVNEEFQSTNEELQSSNEELNTSREELQSLNEELETINVEYQNQIQRLQSDYTELHDLMHSMQVPTVLLDTNLRIKWFTSSIAGIINLIPGDVGRLLSDIVNNLKYPRLLDDAAATLENLTPRTVMAEGLDGCRYEIMFRPLRSSSNAIGGVVISFLNVTKQHDSEQALDATIVGLRQDYALSTELLDTLHEGIVALDDSLSVLWANRAFYHMFHSEPRHVIGKHFYSLGKPNWNLETLRETLEVNLPKHTVVNDFRFSQSLPGGARQTLILNARQISGEDHKSKRILLAIHAVTPAADL